MTADFMIIGLLYIIALILGVAFFPKFTACFFMFWLASDFFKWLAK